MIFPDFSPPSRGQTLNMTQCPEGLYPFLVQRALLHKKPLIFVAEDAHKALQLEKNMKALLPDDSILPFPAWDCLPYDRSSPKPDIESVRLKTLYHLINSANTQTTLITTPDALCQKLPPREFLKPRGLTLKTQATYAPERVGTYLQNNAYHRVQTVRENGEYAVRGSLIDIFPAGSHHPFRLDFFGDEIEVIKTFDPLDQRSLDPVSHVQLLPKSEVILTPETLHTFRQNYRAFRGSKAQDDPLYQEISAGISPQGLEHWLPFFFPRVETLFDYVPDAYIVWPEACTKILQDRWENINDYYSRRSQDDKQATYRPLPPEKLYLSLTEVIQQCEERGMISLSPYSKPCSQALDINTTRVLVDKTGTVPEKLQDLKRKSHKKTVVLDLGSLGAKERVKKILQDQDIPYQDLTTEESLTPSLRSCVGLSLFGHTHSFENDQYCYIVEKDIFGERFGKVPKKSRRADLLIQEASALESGDFVVHDNHGIGRFAALETLDVGQGAHDCLKIIYEGGDKLFVPVENIDMLSRYGSDMSHASLDRLGSSAWQTRKARVKNRLKDMADGLMKLAAQREVRPAPSFPLQDGAYQDFTHRFPFTETDDQDRAIADVFADLQTGRPMERLICGDVGFGKTEVALRAAFLVASNRKQVLVIAPTTLLARQHAQSFQDRFSGFGIQVAQLSRLVSPSQTKKVKEGLADGSIDIVIGTHALLAKSLKFHDPGLIIIDEEQRFGVAQKEKLKDLKHNVHVLTLTATPIPRTLQMALSGVRQMSLITTPPVDRLAVRTFICPFEPEGIREAILREKHRGGQIFYVAPRIDDLTGLAEFLRTHVPEIRFAVAHGQMASKTLEDTMLAFAHRDLDVLLSTNIVESGIDLSHVNTIILHRADLFGLAQLYQLRGRVGRSKVRAYAYLTVPDMAALTHNAKKRLEVMQSLDTLGAGFQLASYDMDIRGGGNLLGEEQSGHIKEVGVELYQQMLEDAVHAAKTKNGTEPRKDTWTPQLNLGLPVRIPDTYVEDLSTRLELYRRLGQTRTTDDTEDLAAELIDRFGPLPQDVENLIQVIHFKQTCQRLNIGKIEVGTKGIVVTFHNHTFANPPALLQFIHQNTGLVKLLPTQNLLFYGSFKGAELKGVKSILETLQAL